METENVNFDNEVLAFLTKRKQKLIEDHREYIASKPEIREVLNDFLSAVLLHKPVSKTLINGFRMMSMCTPKSTSIHLTLLHCK